MGITLALLAMLCFATNIFIARSAMTRMPVEPGFLVMLAVNVLFTATLSCIVLPLRATPFAFQWRGAAWFVLSGVVGIFLGRRMLLDTIRTLGPARASILHSSSPVFTLAVAWVLVGERLGAYELGLAALVILGLWTTQMPSRGEPAKESAEHRPGSEAPNSRPRTRGAILGLFLIAGFGTGNAIRGMAMRGWNEAIFGSLLATAAALLCQAASIRSWPKVIDELRRSDRRGLALFAASGVATACGTMLTTYAMDYIEIAIATLITFTTPLVVFPVSVLVFRNREGLGLRTAGGAVMVLAGIVLLALR
jgi:drug/metabolite transporter (DMT)-like permease